MAMVTSSSNEIGNKIVDIFGIKNCAKLNISINYGEVVKITTEFYPEKDDIVKMCSICKDYIVEIKE